MLRQQLRLPILLGRTAEPKGFPFSEVAIECASRLGSESPEEKSQARETLTTLGMHLRATLPAHMAVFGR